MAYIHLTPEIIQAVAWDAGCQSAAQAGRSKWTAEDYAVCAEVSAELWTRPDIVISDTIRQNGQKSRDVGSRGAI